MRVDGGGFRAQNLGLRDKGLGFRILGFRFSVSGLGFRGTGFRVEVRGMGFTAHVVEVLRWAGVPARHHSSRRRRLHHRAPAPRLITHGRCAARCDLRTRLLPFAPPPHPHVSSLALISYLAGLHPTASGHLRSSRTSLVYIPRLVHCKHTHAMYDKALGTKFVQFDSFEADAKDKDMSEYICIPLQTQFYGNSVNALFDSR